MKKIMIRADDLGYSEGINYGILKTVKDGIIKNIGFMVNMPSTQHGYNLIKDYDVCLGLHTNICVGKPICSPDLIPSLIGQNGEFKSSKEYRTTKNDFVVLDEVILEIEAQYHKFVDITGRKPEYFEGHAVESDNFFKGLEIVAEKYNLKYQKASFDGTPVTVNNNKIYTWLDSSNPQYNPEDFIIKMIEQNHDDGYDLMIFHPGYLDDYILNKSSLTIARTKEVSASCSERIKEYLAKNNINLYTYRDLL